MVIIITGIDDCDVFAPGHLAGFLRKKARCGKVFSLW